MLILLTFNVTIDMVGFKPAVFFVLFLSASSLAEISLKITIPFLSTVLLLGICFVLLFGGGSKAYDMNLQRIPLCFALRIVES